MAIVISSRPIRLRSDPRCIRKKGRNFDDLQGMFAFALYDSEKDAYLIGRDHLGIIPLYMGYDEHGHISAPDVSTRQHALPPSNQDYAQNAAAAGYY